MNFCVNGNSIGNAGDGTASKFGPVGRNLATRPTLLVLWAGFGYHPISAHWAEFGFIQFRPTLEGAYLNSGHLYKL